jgi:aspartate aminotransferase
MSIGNLVMSNSASWADRIHSQPMFDILGEVNAAQKNGESTIHMEIGDTTGFRNQNLIDCVTQRAAEGDYSYSPSSGEFSLLEVASRNFAASIGQDISIDQICVAPANSLITQVLASVTSPGDTILLPDPGFPTYRLAAEFLGLRVCTYGVYGQGHPVIESSDQILSSLGGFKPKVAIINNPSNPLGHVFDWENYSDFFQLLEISKTIVVTDETYQNLTYFGKTLEPFKSDSLDVIRLRSLSKEHAAPALRIGFCIADEPIIRVISRFSSLTFSCLPSFIQRGVADYLMSDVANSFVGSLKSSMEERIIELWSESEPPPGLNRPNAGFYAFVEVGNSRLAFDHLLRCGVAVCPGTAFGEMGSTAIRLSLAGDMDKTSRGFRKVINELPFLRGV